MDGENEPHHATPPGGFLRWRRRHALPPGSACRNCDTILRGPWCYRCGQLGHDFHRSAHHLLGEAFESFFHADGRVFRTLPRLVRDPGRLTRDYLDGRRAPQIPPLRLFLTMLLILFLAGSAMPSLMHFGTPPNSQVASARAHARVELESGLKDSGDKTISRWLSTRLPKALENPGALVAAMSEWAHRFAFLSLPISALLLWIIFIRRRDVFLFDHLVFSMHSLSFQGLLVALVLPGEQLVSGSAGWLLLACPVHLYTHMRGTYGTGRRGTLVRMAFLFVASSVVFGAMLAGLVFIGLSAMG